MKILEGIYQAINRYVADILKPLALRTKEWIRVKRENKKKRKNFSVRVFEFTIQGEHVVTAPNLISLLRPFLAAITAVMITYNIPWYFTFFVGGIALLTDKIDGSWAQIDGHTAFGEFFDPVCDKIALFLFSIPFLGLLWPAVIIPVIVIDLLLLIIAIYAFYRQGKLGKKVNFEANIYGKIKFLLQSAGICFLIFEAALAANIIFAASIFFSFASIIKKKKSILLSLKTP